MSTNYIQLYGTNDAKEAKKYTSPKCSATYLAKLYPISRLLLCKYDHVHMQSS